MIFNFLFGGLIFIIIEYIVNILENPALGAIISMIPIGYMTTFLIKKRSVMVNYIKNIIFVVCCTLLITNLLYFSLRFININQNFIMAFFILLWVGAQYLNYLFVLNLFNIKEQS